MAILCFCPPDSLFGYSSALFSSPTFLRSSKAFSVASVELLPLDVRTQSLINLAGKPEYKHYLDELIKGLSETYTNTVQAETEIIFDADEYCLIDASDILDIVPAWIEQKLGFSKNVIMKPEEQKIALEYK